MMKACVLVIDGYAGFRQAMEYCFSRVGITALTADSVAAALPLMREYRVDLMLLDATQSFGGRLAECRAMKARPEFAAVSIVLLVARVTPQHLEQAHASGAATVLAKVFDWAELMEWVDRAVKERRSGRGAET